MTDDDYENELATIFDDTLRKIAELREQQVRSWPDGDRIVDLAKSMCRMTDGVMLYGRPDHAQQIGPKNSVHIGGGWCAAFPEWWYWLHEAQSALEWMRGQDAARAASPTQVDHMAAVREIAKP